jgi:hypothetical protein
MGNPAEGKRSVTRIVINIMKFPAVCQYPSGRIFQPADFIGHLSVSDREQTTTN